ncbi:MAG: ribonuclease E/G [Actinomycetales bacterium]|nr:MAG: ribonuclease E/G [Actinomycetales bacterium]
MASDDDGSGLLGPADRSDIETPELQPATVELLSEALTLTVPTAGSGEATAPAAPTDEHADEQTEAEQGTRKPAKKTTKRTARNGTRADTTAAFDDPPQTEADQQSVPGIDAASTRKRATPKKKVAPPLFEAADTAADTATDVQQQTGSGGHESEPSEPTEQTEQTGAEPPPSSGLSLLFQPPAAVPARPARSRKRTTPAVDPDVPAKAPEPTDDDGAGAERSERLVEAGDDADHGDEPGDGSAVRRRRRGGRGRRGRGGDAGVESDDEPSTDADGTAESSTRPDADTGADALAESTTRRRTRRRRRGGSADEVEEAPGVVTKVRQRRDEVVGVRGSTRLEAKKQRRREGREAGRRRQIITEAEFLARRESVERLMVVRNLEGRTQIGVLEDDVLVEHYVSRETNASMAGNVYLGKVQNVLPSMEAAFVDIGRGRNAVLYAGEVNWDAAGLESGAPRRIENALESGQAVLVQVTKDPMGHKGARLTSQVSLPGRFLVYVPDSSMTGISRKLPDTERARLKRILRQVVPEGAGVIVRTAAEGASEEELRADVERLTKTWEQIQAKAQSTGKKKGAVPALLHGEPDLTVRVIRDVFNGDFAKLVVAGERSWNEVHDYVTSVAPDLTERLVRWTGDEDVFAHYRIDEQIAKAMDRKVWLPSGGSLVIDRTEAMTVIDVNTGKFIGAGGNLEETVTRNNIEAAEEIVRQLRLRDIGGIIVIDFIDMVLESNRDLVVRRLLECLGRDRTKHQVAEVTSLGLVQMTRKRVGSGLLEAFSEPCAACSGRGYLVHSEPVEAQNTDQSGQSGGGRNRRRRGSDVAPERDKPAAAPSGPTPAQIAAAAHAAAVKSAARNETEENETEETAEPSVANTGANTGANTAADATADTTASTVSGGPAHDPDGASGEAAHADGAPKAGSETPSEPEAGTATTDTEPTPPTKETPPIAATSVDKAVEHDPAPEIGGSTAPPRRRRRGRVVAPAGPPRTSET